MFEGIDLHCPRCGCSIHETLDDKEDFSCPGCQSEFRVLYDPDSKKFAFTEPDHREIPEPLGLPKGSIRALVAISLAGTCWLMVLVSRDVPSYLLSLLLTVIGYYFGFRTVAKTTSGRIYDPASHPRTPLNIPGGGIRGLLMMGFLVSGIVLWSAGKLLGDDMKYLEFYVILAGLIVGHLFARAFSHVRVGRCYLGIHHFKGLAVLGSALALLGVLLLGLFADLPYVAMVLCAVISFYYGSRT